jgi:hypothetical protein
MTSFSYDPATNTIYGRPDSSPPAFSDPISAIRKELAAGQAQVACRASARTRLTEVDVPAGGGQDVEK